MRQGTRAFVDRCDFRSSVGFGDGKGDRERLVEHRAADDLVGVTGVDPALRGGHRRDDGVEATEVEVLERGGVGVVAGDLGVVDHEVEGGGAVRLAGVDVQQARTVGQESIDLAQVVADSEALRLVPQEFARRHRILPLAFEPEERILTIATPQIFNVVALDQLRAILARAEQVSGRAYDPDGDPEVARALRAMTEEIRRAKRLIHCEFYIFSLDSTTEPFFQALEDAVKRRCARSIVLGAHLDRSIDHNELWLLVIPSDHQPCARASSIDTDRDH